MKIFKNFVVLLAFVILGCNTGSSPSGDGKLFDKEKAKSEKLAGRTFHFHIVNRNLAAQLLDKHIVEGQIGSLSDVLYSGNNFRLACTFFPMNYSDLEKAKEAVLNGEISSFSYPLKHGYTSRRANDTTYYFEVASWKNPDDEKSVGVSCSRHRERDITIEEIRRTLAPVFSIVIQ